MEHCKSPEYQEGEREYAELNQNLLQEVSLTVPAVTEPPNVAGSPNVITPPVFAAPEVPGSPSVSSPMTTKDLGSMGLHAEWVQGTALEKPFPGGPLPPATKGFTLGEQDQEHQAKIPQFFNFIGSNMEKSAAGSDKCDIQAEPMMKQSPKELLQWLQDERKAQEKLTEESRGRFQELMNTQKFSTSPLYNENENDNAGIMDLRTTFVTSRQRSQPTIGEATISTQEGERIKAEVCTVMREQFAEARATLRVGLGLPKEVTEKSGEAAPAQICD